MSTEQNQTSAPGADSNPAPLRFPHYELILEHKINVAKFPDETIRKMLQGAEMRRKMSKTEVARNEAVKHSVLAADALQNYLERELPDGPFQNTPPATPTASASTPAQSQQATNPPVAQSAPPKQEEPAKQETGSGGNRFLNTIFGRRS